MALNHTNRLRTSLRQRIRRALSLQATHRRMQFCVFSLVCLLFLAAATPSWAQASPSVEYQVKAAFLLNFARFVRWPSEAFQNDKSSIILCVFRHDPFGSGLDDVIRGRSISNREVLVRRINELADLKSCYLVFVSGLEDTHLPQILDGLKTESALVVGEAEGFAERGGGIQFFLENNRLRFAVNVDAVHRPV